MILVNEIFDKSYRGKELHDVEDDIIEAFNEIFNPCVKDIPLDEFGFHRGRFDIQIIWHANEFKEVGE